MCSGLIEVVHTVRLVVHGIVALWQSGLTHTTPVRQGGEEGEWRVCFLLQWNLFSEEWTTSPQWTNSKQFAPCLLYHIRIVHTFLPPKKGQHLNNGQNTCPKCVHYSEIPLYSKISLVPPLIITMYIPHYSLLPTYYICVCVFSVTVYL